MFGPTEARVMGDPWAPYEPGRDDLWDLRRVVHLHRRAGFSATWEELRRDLADGPQAAVDRLLGGTARSCGVPVDFDRIAGLLAERALAAPEPSRLKGWWVYRMLFGPDPLGERLTLMWHDHFATSNLKVDDLAAMHRQNEALRSLGRGPFGRLLRTMLRDPALLIWLDAPDNTRVRPNENLARELMELFTLGVGHYTESDVKESARALTGWRIAGGEARLVPLRHDPGPETILGRTDSYDAGRLADLLLEQPATADRLAWRLCREFLGETAASPVAVAALAEGLRARDLDVGWAVATILRSRTFFSEANLRDRVASPVEFVIGSVRALELFDPAPSTPLLAEWCGRLGQDLFYPPNVGGWPEGRSWITTRSAIGRANFAAALVDGEGVGLSGSPDLGVLAKQHGRAEDPAFFPMLLLGSDRPAVPVGEGAQLRRAVAGLIASPAGLQA
jgi:Protein of unknown function (DUF1800)